MLQDIGNCKIAKIETNMEQTTQGRPRSSTHHPNEELPLVVPMVVPLPVSKNQFNIL